jgi:hypothetical protein
VGAAAAQAHHCQEEEAAAAAAEGAAGLQATAAQTEARGSPGEVVPEGAPRAELLAGTGGQATGVAGAGLLPEPTLLQVGDLSPARAGRGRDLSAS